MISGFQVSRDPRHQFRGDERSVSALSHRDLALQLRFLRDSESMGNHDSKIVDAGRVD
jgi:hypothetical protein